eukprot:CAMPEP_0185566042 /NCGR_PEP_ID=MMETSP1381-20130426/65911_1 /TAXON_ID=298111 /ORGANISM="Pavlova sp., Strain CCMP459" /LENGTH=78 /DNA_ID=CAMNT_0028179991 /DNA_START=775 /DNA_END=1011 /DNA_ORIENTATION=+
MSPGVENGIQICRIRVWNGSKVVVLKRPAYPRHDALPCGYRCAQFPQIAVSSSVCIYVEVAQERHCDATLSSVCKESL